DGLLYGCGDAVIGVNPAAESVDTVSVILSGLERLIDALGVPTQMCCLAHISTQLAALEAGAPVDLLFQSIAGTQAANASFGVSLAQLREGRERVLEHHRGRDVPWVGDQVMYFETGQGSALSAEAHHGIDQVTLNYQSTSYHDAAAMRELFGLRPAPEFLAWLEAQGLFRGGRLAGRDGAARERLLSGAAAALGAADTE